MCCSLLTNTVVQTYNAGKPVWSCCWCLDNSNYVYAGLSNGSVLVYDTRDTSTHVQELQPLRSRYTRTKTLGFLSAKCWFSVDAVIKPSTRTSVVHHLSQ